MSVNFSTSSNESLLFSYFDCLIFRSNIIILTINHVLLLLPLCSLILYHGLQRWWKQRSTSQTPSDTFTYHVAIIELINVFGSILCCFGIYSYNTTVLFVWLCLFCIVWYGESLFHVVTCVDHYLAVVHPITYLSLKKKRVIIYISIVCIWLFCFGGMIIFTLDNTVSVVDFCVLTFSVIIISFCSFSVLFVLSRPGPGDQTGARNQGRDRSRVDQSKQRAFYTIMAILGVLLLRCGWNLVWTVLNVLHVNLSECVWISIEMWMNLPGSLVLPLLFLHKTGMLPCCKNK